MANRDFDESDAEWLAEFADETIVANHGLDADVVLIERGEKWHVFEPWDDTKPQWQIHSLKDAVREKGLEDKFCWEILDVLKINEEKRFLYDDIVDCVSAPPEAICAAILKLEGE